MNERRKTSRQDKQKNIEHFAKNVAEIVNATQIQQMAQLHLGENAPLKIGALSKIDISDRVFAELGAVCPSVPRR
ncbi:hypothetical protein H6F67_07120 [Microcoleus sp. FACHB-1515]|uniref:hypothetical protein n=1 Tax=Cyanophyceae TaxID=3028117 RepID=UPI00168246F0|nr:hypothetical protein [Microcoleus sp. FACHB-1515]MBD2089622.1 hypothetical protein [Microcoleus sp. FACHB-1515]